MKTAIINVKTKPITKARAQKVADELGFGLSTLINGFLNQLIKVNIITSSLHFLCNIKLPIFVIDIDDATYIIG